MKGTVSIQGSKNTVLPIIAASLLADGVSVIYNCPHIDDVEAMCELLNCLNVETKLVNNVLTIDTSNARYACLPEKLTCKLRSSVLLLGAMLAKWGHAGLGMPGGCAIGMRPIDIHLDGLRLMNVNIDCEEGMLCCSSKGLKGCDYTLRFPSVGATENLLIAASGIGEITILRGAAKEPEVIELCKYLMSMGACIEGIGTEVLIIKGTANLKSVSYTNVYDRIVAGTYLLLATAVCSEVRLTGINDISYLKNIIGVCVKLGACIIKINDSIRIASDGLVKAGSFSTGIYPDFPTDLQPVLASVLMKAYGESVITETVFEKRFSIVNELLKLGAAICVDKNKIIINGKKEIHGHTVKATDLRQGAALVVAGVMAKGYTTITDISFIERGYEDIVRDIASLGADIAYA
ncbi:MAG: UDP-N-acetylglucosamine 1-carboxyvinyltransferase [Lachnospiraceae bacterium]|nr:UDP-N-acetylglucosamine 1-carboxyvinyltransferase [Lachnospiraceae bacterium]